MKGIKWWLCLGMLIAVLYGSARTGMAEDPAIARGLDWLQAQVRGDGTLLGEDGSLAVVEQTRSEVAHTLAQTGRTVALPDLTLRPTSDLSTELLSRRAIGLGALGRTQDAADVVSVLMGRSNADGGFGGAAGQPSNPLDTALALLAMRAGGIARNTRAQAALGYLGGAAGADGAYAFGQPTYTTAYALQAFSRYRNDYSLATAIQRTRAALIARGSAGSYGDPVSDAVATIALSLSGPSADAAGAVTALRNAQLSDGSWQQDPYVTALALRALSIAVDPPSTNAGRILGEVYDANAGLPIAQVQVAIDGATPRSVFTGADGAFVLDGVSAGSYTLTVSRVGYADHVARVEVVGGTDTQVGRIALSIADDRASLRGTISHSRTGIPLADARIRVTGPLTAEAQSSASGAYELVGLPTGDYSIEVTLDGFQPIVQSATLPARTALTFSPALTPVGETPPSDADVFGLVVKASDGAPIAGASVQIGAASAVTGADGRFDIADLPIGAVTGSVAASGYANISFTGVLVAGRNDLGRLPLASSQTTRTVIGTVTSSATGLPIADVGVALNGAQVARTDADGHYRIEDTAAAEVELRFDALGYRPDTRTALLANPGTYRLDVAIDDLLEGSFQVLNLDVAPPSLAPDATLRLRADIANLNTSAKSALVLVRVLDPSGVKVAQLCGAESIGLPEQCEFDFAAGQVRSFALDWVAANLPTGPYSIAVHVVEPGSITSGAPLGLIYGLDNRDISIESSLRIEGAVTPSTPVMIPGSPAGVELRATVRNVGNDLLPAGQATLHAVDRASGTVALSRSVAFAELLPSDLVELDFGQWAPPASGAQYDLRVRIDNPAVTGEATGQFTVGDAATAEFEVTPVETADGNQRVEAVLTVKGVDNPSGQGVDPLFALVRQAVGRGGTYTGVNARNWQNSNRCLGCHTQTQSLYGLASSLDKADIDRAATLYMQNSQSASIQSDGSIFQAHPEFRFTSSILGLWSMTAWPDHASTFNARYRVASYLYDRRTAPSNGVYWWRDHDTGWLVENTAPTATVVEGIASVLEDAARFGITQTRSYRSTQRATAPARLVDIAGAPDGRVYALLADGRIHRYDPADNSFTLFATARLGTAYTSIAVAADGRVYVGSTARSGQPPVIERVDATQNLAVATLPFYADALDVAADGAIVTLNRAQRAVYRVDPATGGNVRIAFGGAIPTAAAYVTALPDGAVLVGNDSGAYTATVRIAPGGATSLIHEGGLYPLRDIAVGSGGRLYIGGSDAFYDVDAQGVAERHTAPGGRNRIAVADGRVYALNPSANTAFYEVEPVMSDIAPRLAQMRQAMQDTARFFETYSNFGVPAEAFRLILLAETRPYISDAALAQRVDARIPQLVQALRAAQRADGGWSRYSGWASDPLTTAIVGTALDYSDPLPTDPVLRKTVQYLLSTQGSDGSWSGQYFSTRLGATSYVMAYLPKAVRRLGGIETGLGLEFGNDVRLVSSSVAPSSSGVGADGSSSYFFQLGRIGSVGARFTFTLDLLAMRIDEWRQIARRAFLRFVNSFTGETVEAPIAIPSVHASSKYQLSLSLNRYVFDAREEVVVQPTIRNGGSSFTSGSVRYFIETAEGAPVAELSTVAFADLAIGMQQTLPQPWNTGTTPSGAYRARVVLYSPDGQRLGEAVQSFTIRTTANGPQLTSSVATDRAIYDPFDTVRILGRVRNTTLNARFENLDVEEAVTAPDGSTVWNASVAVATLEAGQALPVTFGLGLTAAPPGVYTVTQTVRDAAGTTLDVRTAQFEVRATSVGGAGLAGTIAAVPQQVETGETTSLAVTVVNRGNAALTALPLVVSVIDLDNETVLATWTRTEDLALGESLSFAQPWSTQSIPAGDYHAVLQARVGGRLIDLAQGPVRVIAPPLNAEMTQRIAASGRLLVLISCKDRPGAGPLGAAVVDAGPEDSISDIAASHTGDACVASRVNFVDQLLTRMGVAHAIVTTGPAFAAEYATGRYDMYWISGGALKLANLTAEELREAVHQGDGLLVDGSHDARNQILNDALGVKHQGHLPGSGRNVYAYGDFQVGTFHAAGDAIRYSSQGARAQASFDSASGVPAFFVHDHGHGGSAVAGFDLVAALAAESSATQAEALLRRTLAHMAPPAPTFGVAGGYLSVRTDVRNLGSAGSFVLRHQAGDPLRVEDAAPTPEGLTPAMVQWRFPLAIAEQRSFLVGLRLPTLPGTYALGSQLSAGEPQRLLATANQSVTVAAPSQLATLLDADLAALAPTTASDRNARDHARSWLASASSALAAGDRDAAVGDLLKAIQELSKITSVPTDDVRLQASTLVKAARVARLP